MGKKNNVMTRNQIKVVAVKPKTVVSYNCTIVIEGIIFFVRLTGFRTWIQTDKPILALRSPTLPCAIKRILHNTAWSHLDPAGVMRLQGLRLLKHL